MGFKKTKIAVASLMLASLAACSNNKADLNNAGPRNVSTGDLRNAHDLRTRDMDRVTLNRANDLDRRDNNLIPRTNDRDRNNNRLRTESMLDNFNSTTEIQPMNKGFVTIAPNSFSTDTPSDRFPHSRRVDQGNFWYYTFTPAKPNTSGLPGYAQQPQYGMVTPQRGGQTGQYTGQQRGGQTGTTTPPSMSQNGQRQNSAATPQTQRPTTQAPVGIGSVAQQVINLTNAERKKAGLPALKADASLSRVAQSKSNDMESKHYFSHTSPTYGSPFDMMRDFGVTYKSAGENIAMGQTSAQSVVNAWMNSEGHRKNILSPNFTNIGVGYTQNGNYWSQMFIGK